MWDPDGRVHDTLAATEGHWILVRPDGYVSARGADNTSLRDALDRLTSLRGRERHVPDQPSSAETGSADVEAIARERDNRRRWEEPAMMTSAAYRIRD